MCSINCACVCVCVRPRRDSQDMRRGTARLRLKMMGFRVVKEEERGDHSMDLDSSRTRSPTTSDGDRVSKKKKKVNELVVLALRRFLILIVWRNTLCGFFACLDPAKF